MFASLQTAVLATLAATRFGTAAADGLYRTTSGLKGIVFAIVLLPALVPAVLVAIGVSSLSPALASVTT